jgi:hypothetical protein
VENFEVNSNASDGIALLNAIENAAYNYQSQKYPIKSINEALYYQSQKYPIKSINEAL